MTELPTALERTAEEIRQIIATEASEDGWIERCEGALDASRIGFTVQDRRGNSYRVLVCGPLEA